MPPGQVDGAPLGDGFINDGQQGEVDVKGIRDTPRPELGPVGTGGFAGLALEDQFPVYIVAARVWSRQGMQPHWLVSVGPGLPNDKR